MIPIQHLFISHILLSYCSTPSTQYFIISVCVCVCVRACVRALQINVFVYEYVLMIVGTLFAVKKYSSMSGNMLGCHLRKQIFVSAIDCSVPAVTDIKASHQVMFDIRKHAMTLKKYLSMYI